MTEKTQDDIDKSRVFVKAVTSLFNEVVPRTPEEIDEILRSEGYDPDEIGTRLGAELKAAMAAAMVESVESVESVE